MNWRWPASQSSLNVYAPWYTILRRAILVPVLFCCLVALAVVTFLGWGWQAACDVWEDFR